MLFSRVRPFAPYARYAPYVMTILALSLFSLTDAQAHPRCGMPQGSPCSEFYSHFDAFRKLQAAENSDEDALGNLDIVESVQRAHGLNLEYVVDNFIYIQQALGGSNETSNTRASFLLVSREIRHGNRLDELTTQFVRIVQNENDIADAQGNFGFVMSPVRKGMDLLGATELFLDTLKLEGGSNSTAAARLSFNMFLDNMNAFDPREQFESYRDIVAAENSRDDAVSDFKLVLRAAEKCGKLDAATKDFLAVLRQMGGSNSTSAAQSLYKRLYGI